MLRNNMIEHDDLARTEELFSFLQGNVPKGYKIRGNMPRLTADQAWIVIWYLGNQYWQVTDHVERCDVCGILYESESEGSCLDYGIGPYSFCDDCMYTEEYVAKAESRLNPENKRKQ